MVQFTLDVPAVYRYDVLDAVTCQMSHVKCHIIECHIIEHHMEQREHHIMKRAKAKLL